MTYNDEQERGGTSQGVLDLKTRILSPQAALLVLIAACNLFLVHALVVLMVVEPPYGTPELILMWGTGVVGAGLLVFGGIVGWESLRHLRSTEARLSEARSRLQALVDASPLAIMAEDRRGRTMLWNRTAERVFGWREDEVLGEPPPIVPGSESAAWSRVRDRVLDGQVVTDLVTRRTTRRGELLEISLSSAPMRNGDGEVHGAVTLLADVTERQRADRERERLEEQLRQSQKMEAVGRLAGGVAHDFNNLLTAIKGHAELLLDDDAPEAMREDLGEISRSTDRATALTRQLLAFSRQSMVEPRPLDLNALIRDMERLLRRVIGERVALDTSTGSDLGLVLADPGQVEQVLMNLVVNARDAMPHGGSIAIHTANAEITPAEAKGHTHRVVPGQYVVISVTDTGTGMAPEVRERIFEPFFTTKPVGVGTGLGLSTTYGIVKQARGYIWVDSEPGQGSTFNVYLPRVESDQEAAPVRVPRRAPSTPVAQGTETVLVVEDEEPVLALARKVLERRGYNVLTASRGQDALRQAREFPGEVHLIFCDVVMPDLSGREIIQRVKRLRPGVRVLMTSGYAEQVVAEQGAVADGMPFLSKPYTPDTLAGAVRSVLEDQSAGHKA